VEPLEGVALRGVFAEVEPPFDPLLVEVAPLALPELDVEPLP